MLSNACRLGPRRSIIGARRLKFEWLETRALLTTSPAVLNLSLASGNTVFGEAQTIRAVVTAGDLNTLTPTGSVDFIEAGNTLATISLDNTGVADWVVTTLAVGSHTIRAVYAGDANYNLATSIGPVVTSVSQAGTTTAVVSNLPSSALNQAVTFTATVSAVAPGAGTPTGQVEFRDQGTLLATATINNLAQATYQTSTLTGGSHTITVNYLGDSQFLASHGSVQQSVQQIATTTTLSASRTTSTVGQSVTFTAQVTSTVVNGPAISGSVSFVDGSTVLATRAVLASGRVTFATSGLSAGSHSITAVYNGNTSLAASTSTGVSVAVAQGTTTTTLVLNPGVQVPGSTVTLTANVRAPLSPLAARTGTVSFYDGATLLGTATVLPAPGLLNGLLGVYRAVYTTSALSLGTHALTAVYGGDANFFGSSSSAASQKIVPALSKVTVTTSAATATFGNTVTFTAQVAANSAGTTTTPTGTVNFYDGNTLMGSSAVDGSGQATFATSALAIGNHVIAARYQGDSTFGPSSKTLLQTVQSNVLYTATTVAGVATINGAQQSLTLSLAGKLTTTPGGTTYGLGPTGSLAFVDSAKNVSLVATAFASVFLSADGSELTIYGTATLNGQSTVSVRVRLVASGGTTVTSASVSFVGRAGIYNSGLNAVDGGSNLTLTNTSTPR